MFTLAKTRPRGRKRSDKNTKRVIATALLVAVVIVISILYLRAGPVLPVTTSTQLIIAHVTIDAGSGSNPSLPGYSPVNVTVVVGVNNTVTWVNEDAMPHTVTAFDGSFDSGNLDQGQSFTHTFEKTGIYSYTCIYHHWMHGMVTVFSEFASPEAVSTISGNYLAIYAFQGVMEREVEAFSS